MELKKAYAVLKCRIGYYSDVVVVCESEKEANEILMGLEMTKALGVVSERKDKYTIVPVEFKPRKI